VYFNAHGPGTRQCDGAESQLFDELFPGADGIFSFKPLVGHCQAAAAAVEVAISCLSYQEGIIPAPPSVAPGHDRLISGPVVRESGVTLKSSIGMGGYNTAILLDEPAENAIPGPLRARKSPESGRFGLTLTAVSEF